jgi:hypothetical protein
MNQKKSLGILNKCLDEISNLTQEEFDVRDKMIENKIEEEIFNCKLPTDDAIFFLDMPDRVFIKKSNFKKL